MCIGCNVEIGYSVQGLVAKVKEMAVSASVWGTPVLKQVVCIYDVM